MNHCIKYWNNSFNRFYDVLNKCIDNNDRNGIVGLITFINTLIKEIDYKGEVITSDYVQFFNAGDEYTFICPERNFKQVVIVGIQEPVWSVREKISYYSKIPINNVTFKNNKRFINYNDDFSLFNELAIKNYIVDIIETGNILSSLSTNPRTMIKNDETIFNSLFKLLKQYKLSEILLSDCKG